MRETEREGWTEEKIQRHVVWEGASRRKGEAAKKQGLHPSMGRRGYRNSHLSVNECSFLLAHMPAFILLLSDKSLSQM